jgi:hypothetical protein
MTGLRQLTIIALLACSGSVLAADIAYLYADQPTAPGYTISNDSTYSPLGDVVVTRASTGTYDVSFGGPFGTPERNVQVSAVGTEPGYCKLWGWTTSAISVACFDLSGAPADRPFAALVTLAGADAGFLHADQPTTPSYQPSARTTSANLQGRVTVERANTGYYYVDGPAAGDGIAVQITATGRDATYCMDGVSRDRVVVRCYAPGGEPPRGTPADSTFSLLITSAFGENAAFVRSLAETESSFTLDARNARSSEGGDVEVRMVGKARYEADLGSIIRPGSTVQVIAHEGQPKTCTIESWRAGTVTVRCFDLRGDPSATEFVLLARRAGPEPIVIDPSPPGPAPGPGPVPVPEAESFAVVDFDHLPDGSPVASGSTLRFEYRDLGAVFPAGVTTERCARALPCPVGEADNQAGAPLALGEFRNQPFDMRFTRGRQRVAFYVVARSDAGASTPVAAVAYGESGEMLDSVRTEPLAPGAEISVTLRSRAPDIARVAITRGESTGSPDNLFFVDTIRLYGEGDPVAAYADDSRPTVEIRSPASFARIESATTDVAIAASDARGLASVNVQLQAPGGDVLVPFERGSVCGETTDCRGTDFTGSIEIALPEEGHYEILARACSTNGNCDTERKSVSRVFPERREVDLWVMGLEYNQQWQDTIYTDLLNDGSEGGRVPLRHPSNRDTELSLPIVVGKPMVARAYVGIRDGAGLDDGVPITGRLRIDDGTAGGMGWTFSPLANENCASHIAGRAADAGQRCLAQVMAYPTLGRLGYTTNTDYDLDLIRQRIHWEGTLNFVIPAEVTARALDPSRGGSGLTLNFEVFPADAWDADRNPDGVWQETNGRDNRFQLQLENSEREDIRIRLVRVAMPGAPAPARDAAHRAIEEMQRILPLSSVDIDVESEYFYDGGTTTLRGDFFGTEIDVDVLDQCMTLWLDLYFTYGLNPDAPLVALVPDAVDGCRGVGWDVPNLELLREGRGRALTYAGGIAHSRMPDYSRGEDWGRVATLAMEVRHALYDARHVSNLHGEADGCPLTANEGGALLGFVTDALGMGLDMSCYKPTVHPHATIGSYPPVAIRSGRPGDVSGTLSGSRIFGNLGGFGVRIDPDGASYRLTMYDPCPTGPLDMDDPDRVLRLRMNPERGYDCQISEDLLPHDVMSYGSPAQNRWYSIQVTPGLKNIREGL